MDLIWGYTGILSLGPRPVLRARRLRDGHVPDAPDRPRRHLPQRPARLHGVPRLEGAALALERLPTASASRRAAGRARCRALLAFVFGFFAFRSRIKGVYFSIITQALTFAAMLLFFRNETGFGGNNGFTDFKRILGHRRCTTPATRMALFVLTGARAARRLPALPLRWSRSKFGRVLQAIRDAEIARHVLRLRPAALQALVWTLSAVMCGIAGALYVPQVGIINPSEMSPANSIEIAIWAAVGGRGTLVGADPRRAPRQRRARAGSRWRIPSLAVLPRRAVHRSSRCSCRDGIVGLVRKLRAASTWRRRAPRRPAQARHERRRPSRRRPTMEAGAERSRHRRCTRRRRAARRRRQPRRARHRAHGLILYLDDVSVSFDGFKALNELSLDIDAGRAALHHRPQRRRQDDDDGRHHRQDAARRGHACSSARRIDLTALTRSRDRAAAASAASSRSPTVFEQLHGVREPRARAARPTRACWRDAVRAPDAGEQRDRIDEMLETDRPDERARRAWPGLLSHGQKQWLEIGMLLMQDPKLLLLDEPVAGMTARGDRAHRRAAPVARGQALAWWSSSTTWSSCAASRSKVTVLHEGSVLAEGPHGRGAERPARDRGLPRGRMKRLLQRRSSLNQYYGGSHTLWDVDLECRRASRVVPHGPQRRGQDHAAQVPHGPAAGDVGRDHVRRHATCAGAPAERARALGIGYVPQGREIFAALTVEENLRMGLASRKRGARDDPGADLRAVPGAEADAAAGAAATCRAASSSSSPSAARWRSSPKLLILDEPTEGIQPNIVHEIGDIILALNRGAGVTVLLVEQKLPFARRVARSFRILESGRVVATAHRRSSPTTWSGGT